MIMLCVYKKLVDIDLMMKFVIDLIGKHFNFECKVF